MTLIPPPPSPPPPLERLLGRLPSSLSGRAPVRAAAAQCGGAEVKRAREEEEEENFGFVFFDDEDELDR